MAMEGQQIKDQSLKQSMEAAAAVAIVVEEIPLNLLFQELEGELNPNFFLEDNAYSRGKQQQEQFIAIKDNKKYHSPSLKKDIVERG